MCVVFFIIGHPKYKLILASNRDEYLNRPTRRAHFWESQPHILGGIDLGHHPSHDESNKSNLKSQEETGSSSYTKTPTTEFLYEAPLNGHGTWLGVSKQGHFSVVTNFREHPSTWLKKARSRGYLIRDFLFHRVPPIVYVKQVSLEASLYNGFNLIVGNVLNEDVWVVSNRVCRHHKIPEDQLANHSRESPRQSIFYDKCLPQKVYGISNGYVCCNHNREWHKVRRGKHLFTQVLQSFKGQQDLIHGLFQMMQDTVSCSDHELPENMFDYHLEKKLAPICIDRHHFDYAYATRTQTILLVDRNNHVIFIEKDRYLLEEEKRDKLNEESNVSKAKDDNSNTTWISSSSMNTFDFNIDVE